MPQYRNVTLSEPFLAPSQVRHHHHDPVSSRQTTIRQNG